MRTGTCSAWLYTSVLSLIFPGDTKNGIDLFQGNMSEIEKLCGFSTKDKMIRFHKQNKKKMLIFSAKLKRSIQKAPATNLLKL